MIEEREASVAQLVAMARNSCASVARQHAAFTTLVERFQKMALATARAASSDDEFAKDACQAAFLSAWRMLPTLRDPSAFGAWLRRLVRTQCARDRRRRSASTSRLNGAVETELIPGPGTDPAELASRNDWHRTIRQAIASLPDAECRAITLFYLYGESLRVVARALGVSEARAGKLAYSARLRLRRSLSHAVTEAFLDVKPAPAFVRRVQAGVFDEFVGEYRFPTRPGHPVIIRREGSELASYSGGQRNVLASRENDALTPTEFDGEARFRRNGRGQVSHFIYYEFGKRLGVARRVADVSVP
jgi:RNA polymerase sigma-70 factor (ECF subfamily)